jgi:murein DD-endopeptidase MepM/ murein hydrolase activator NlpD
MPNRTNRHIPSAEAPGRNQRAHAPGSGSQRGYTLNHAGRQVRFGPVTFWLSVSVLIVMGLWSAATATYFAFRDDVLTRLIARQADMQYAYEDRVSELRSQVDRLTSRQLLDQEQVEQRMEQLSRRQRNLEARTTALSGLPDDAATGSIRANPRALQRKGGAAGAAPKPSPLNDGATPPHDRQSAFGGTPTRQPISETTTSVATALLRFEEGLDRIESRQGAMLLAMEDGYEAKARRMRGVLSDLGVDLRNVTTGPAAAGVGGPFIPPGIMPDTGAFDRQMRRVQIARANVERLSRVVLNVPIRKPLGGEIDTSSGFGVRLDPFLRRPAMHTGLDFRGESGEPVRATAAGTVSTAGWNGGYGRMVEIEHENGFSTRYAHLSNILVKEGQTIKPGQVIGRVGSTGRSTGPHLHYETRIEGDAVDPHKFLRAGERLGEKP